MPVPSIFPWFLLLPFLVFVFFFLFFFQKSVVLQNLFRSTGFVLLLGNVIENEIVASTMSFELY